MSKSGLDVDGTYLPPAIHPSIAPEPKTDMKTAMLEAEMVMGGAVADVLEKTGARSRVRVGGGGARHGGRVGVEREVGRRGAGVWQGGRECEARAARASWARARARARAHAPARPRPPRRAAGIKPEQVDILITNCSIFCPTPSLASMLINKFKFRRDVEAYHLGGMGCSIGVVAVGLVRDMLEVGARTRAPGCERWVCMFELKRACSRGSEARPRPATRGPRGVAHALNRHPPPHAPPPAPRRRTPTASRCSCPAEITTYCFYPGKHKDFLVSNAIFRMGGAAMLMTNKPELYGRCKYELQHAERVHTGQDDTSYNCISWGPDPDGVNGVFLGKDVPQEAGKARRACGPAPPRRVRAQAPSAPSSSPRAPRTRQARAPLLQALTSAPPAPRPVRPPPAAPRRCSRPSSPRSRPRS